MLEDGVSILFLLWATDFYRLSAESRSAASCLVLHDMGYSLPSEVGNELVDGVARN
jgi:hypothetical protein